MQLGSELAATATLWAQRALCLVMWYVGEEEAAPDLRSQGGETMAALLREMAAHPDAWRYAWQGPGELVQITGPYWSVGFALPCLEWEQLFPFHAARCIGSGMPAETLALRHLLDPQAMAFPGAAAANVDAAALGAVLGAAAREELAAREALAAAGWEFRGGDGGGSAPGAAAAPRRLAALPGAEDCCAECGRALLFSRTADDAPLCALCARDLPPGTVDVAALAELLCTLPSLAAPWLYD